MATVTSTLSVDELSATVRVTPVPSMKLMVLRVPATVPPCATASAPTAGAALLLASVLVMARASTQRWMLVAEVTETAMTSPAERFLLQPVRDVSCDFWAELMVGGA